jgi:hypothetical protein
VGHRVKHRDDALVRRVAAGRKIKSDETPEGRIEWHAVKDELAEGIITVKPQREEESNG